MPEKVKVGIIGVGNISPRYISGCRSFDILDLVTVADINMERANQVAAENQLKAQTVDEMLADPTIDIVLNLTIPAAHTDVSLKVIEAGKHVYSEKPLATTLADGKKIIDAAKAKGVRVGCAPDTFLFAEHQTCRKLLDDGKIGQAVAATGFMMSGGHESWHPNPDFYYQPGGGPMLDMGPYYVTCLVNLLGAVKRVAGSVSTAYPERIAKDGHRIAVNVPTHYTGTLEFASGAVATLVMSFDISAHRLPMMDLYGSKGTLQVPDPNGYQKEVRLMQPGSKVVDDIALMYPTEWARGVGVADMAYGITTGRPHRASGDLAYHVLEIMTSFEEAWRTGKHIEMQSTVERPASIPVGLPPRQLDS